MAYIKPSCGDLKYGFKSKFKKENNFTGQALHDGLLVYHPGTGEYMEFTAPLPQEPLAN